MDSNRTCEIYTGHAKSIKLKTLNKVAKSLCAIKIDNIKTTGFFIKFERDEINPRETSLFALVSSHHLLPNILGKKNIVILIDISKKKEIIRLNIKGRKMKYFEPQNIAVIEIIDKDFLEKKVEFLSCDFKCNSEIYKNYLNTDIFIMYHPNGEELECCSGKIIKVNEPKEFNFEHSLDIKNGSSGSPILLFEKSDDEPEVIGIQTSSVCENKNNVGTFINLFKEKLVGKENYNEYIKDIILNPGSSLIVDSDVNLHIQGLSLEKNTYFEVRGTLILGDY